MGARSTALRKPDGGVRGIAVGTTMRRIVDRTLATPFSTHFETECFPFQYALRGWSLRSCVSCSHVGKVGQHGRGTGHFRPLCGCSTPSHPATSGLPTMGSVAQSLRQKEENGETLGRHSCFRWGYKGRWRRCLRLLPGAQWSTVVDDVCLVCRLHRVHLLSSLVADAHIRTAGIQLHQGKTRMWNRSHTVLDGVEDSGLPSWGHRLVSWSLSGRR